jgi:hypothetical protein
MELVPLVTIFAFEPESKESAGVSVDHCPSRTSRVVDRLDFFFLYFLCSRLWMNHRAIHRLELEFEARAHVDS